MLFMFRGEPKPGLTEEDQRRVLQVFRGWTPPAGIEIKAHYLAVSGGDYVIVEATSVAAMIEAVTNWAPYVTYQVTPIVEVADGVGAIDRAVSVRSAIV